MDEGKGWKSGGRCGAKTTATDIDAWLEMFDGCQASWQAGAQQCCARTQLLFWARETELARGGEALH
jgi:hypothetical protein